MSTDSKSQSSNQPPLSQLWPGFGSTTSDLSTQLEHHHQPSANQQALGKHPPNQPNNNNNYVNFNQFIMQHNLTSPHQTKPEGFGRGEGQNTNYDDVFNFIHNMGNVNNNNNNNAKGNNPGSINSNHHNHQQQHQQHHQQQQYNVSL